MQNPLDISQEIGSALNRGEPVVALESSVIAQGLPTRINVETALAMEENVRKSGATPATVGVIEGKLRVGLTTDEIEKLGKRQADKLAVRDLPYAVTRKLDGAATVSSTIRIAFAAGIGVTATGGIGGVHRDFAQTGDVSADLWELARTPMIVVCSGAKSVVDVPATAEWLETRGVPVYGFETDDLPLFYSRSSGIKIPKLDGAREVADIATLFGGAMGMRCAMLITVPVPKSSDLDVSSEVEQAEKDAARKGIKGKELTPYLLHRVGELTKGKSVDSNVALLKNNAKVAGEIAVSLAEDSQRRVGFIA